MAKADVFKDVNYPDRLNKRESKVVETAKSGCLNFARRSFSYSDLIDGTTVEVGDALPKGAILQRAYVIVSEAFASSDPDVGDSVDVSFDIDGNELIAESATNGSPFSGDVSSTGTRAVTNLDGTLSNYITLSQDSKVSGSLTIVNDKKSTDDPAGIDEELSAGKFDIIIEYVVV